jgi:hypothetical protein|tara:strand:+ start:411 stop:1970 length:1560 start_codon:yes stop_codon:yes gene_type:complete
MKAYAQEIKDGLQELIENNTTIAYCSPVISEAPTLSTAAGKYDKDRAMALNFLGLENSQAENKEQIDLYYLSSVLVSTGWNKNDDVFDAQEMWEARSTPEDKQFNYMHNEKDIIGHITANYVVDFEGNSLDGDLSFAEAGSPTDFNIITQGVLYKSWSDPELRERMNNIIEEIEEGNRWYVSMECLFPNFDYALKDETGASKIVRREEASAFLSKHLRAYGGTGRYEGYTVGRLLRNISFSGKGLVSKPANPRSVILNDSKSFSENDSELVAVSSIKETKMSDVLQKQLEEVKAELAEARTANETMKQEMEAQKTEAIESQLQKFEETISAKDQAIAEVQAQVEEALARVKELEEALAASEAAKEEAIAQVAEIEKAAALEKRVAALTEAGLEGEELDEAIAKFENLDEETFEFVVAAMTKKKAEKKDDKENPFAKKDKKEDEEKEAPAMMKKKAEVEVLEEEVDEAEAEAQAEELEEAVEDEDIAMAEAIDDEDSSEELRSTASEWFGSLLKSTANLK